MIPKKFLLLIISLFWVFYVLAQSINDVVDFANQQYQTGNYTIAAKEYNRAFFFGYEHKDILALQIAKCYTNQGLNEQAELFYDKAYFLAKSDSVKNEAILGKSYTLLIREQFVLAITELLNFTNQATTQQQVFYHFYKGIAHFGLYNDSTSLVEFNEIITFLNKNDSCKTALNNEFETIQQCNKKYNPKRAYLLSGLMPGLGQFSISEYKEGLNSMLLIGALCYISFRIVTLYSFADAFVAMLPWIQRYYNGGMENAKVLAQKKITNKRYESYLKIIELTSPPIYE